MFLPLVDWIICKKKEEKILNEEIFPKKKLNQGPFSISKWTFQKNLFLYLNVIIIDSHNWLCFCKRKRKVVIVFRTISITTLPRKRNFPQNFFRKDFFSSVVVELDNGMNEIKRQKNCFGNEFLEIKFKMVPNHQWWRFIKKSKIQSSLIGHFQSSEWMFSSFTSSFLLNINLN